VFKPSLAIDDLIASKASPSGDKPVRTRARKARTRHSRAFRFDPMPDRVEPCLALLQSKRPVGPEWTYETKWDGYRMAVHVDPQRIHVITRGGHDWTHRFLTIVEAAKQLGVATAILDGDAVLLDEQGREGSGQLLSLRVPWTLGYS
jgi:bifunctional non-homologous end joining protein LigD